MVSTIKLIGRIIPIVFIIIIGNFEITSANKICQNLARKIMVRHCGAIPGTAATARAKRELEQPEVYIENFEPGAGEIEFSEYRYPVKRQLDAGAAAIANVARPVVEEIIQGALNRRPYGSPMGARYQPPYQYAIPVAPTYPGAPPQYIVAAAAPAPGLYQSDSILSKTLLPQTDGENLGLSLTSDEKEELYDEISNRLARKSGMSEDEHRNLFYKTIAKCCPHENLCYEEIATLIEENRIPFICP